MNRSCDKVDKQCKSKVRHATAAIAELEAARLRAQFSRRYAAYKCRHCDGWHCGKRKLGAMYKEQE